MELKDEVSFIGMLLRYCLANEKSGIGTLQCRLALLRSLPSYVRTPAKQNFTQIADSDIYCGSQVNWAITAFAHAIIAKCQYFGAHALLPNRSMRRMETSG
jgi:hypothetical protein